MYFLLLSSVFSARRYASAVYAMALCLFVWLYLENDKEDRHTLSIKVE